MRKSLKKIVAGAASLLLLGAGAAFAEMELVLPEDTEAAALGPNVDPDASYVTFGDALAEPRGATYSFNMGPGGSWGTNSQLSAAYPSDKDTFVMTITAATRVTVTVVDCCIMGDTMCVGSSAKKKVCAVSPSNPTAHTAVLRPGKYTFYAVYTNGAGGFPAGYSITVEGN